MGRAIAVILVFLAAGFIVNLVVAWSIAAQVKFMDFDAAATAEARRQHWERDVADDAVWVDRLWITRGMVIRFYHETGRQTAWSAAHEAGWPMHSLRGWVKSLPAGPHRFAGAVDLKDDITMEVFVGANPTPAFRDTTPKALPLIPMWPGALVNTAFYAAVLAVVAGVVLVFRTSYRVMRGRCPWCAYDLRRRLADGCPECGWRRTPTDDDHSVPSPEANPAATA